jgi:hypothetical protein
MAGATIRIEDILEIERDTFMKRLVLALIAAGSIGLCVAFYKNIVLYSLANNHTWILKAFLMAGLNPDMEIDGERLIGHAIDWKGENAESIELLIDYGADINHQGQFGSFLAKSLTYGRLDVTRLLVKRGITMRGLWFSSPNLGDEDVIVQAIPDTLNNQDYCKEYSDYRSNLRDSWPGVFAAFNVKCGLNN